MTDPKQIPPAVDQVREFLASLGSKTSAEDFHDFYTERGWRAGRVPMKDWQAAARRWHRNGWGLGKHEAAKLTEWERKQKQERIRDLRERQRAITNPGGSAYPARLDEAKLAIVDKLQAEIDIIKKELM